MHKLRSTGDVFFEEESIRGASPSLLLGQIRNTLPYLTDTSRYRSFPHLALILDLQSHGNVIPSLNHSEYFRLCLASHMATVASYVPTDVDNQIRFRLWHPSVSQPSLKAMVETVLESLDWDYRVLSSRWIVSPSGQILAGHHGEWLGVAVGAYGATWRQLPSLAQAIKNKILTEIQRQLKVYDECKKAREGIKQLKASALIAHNLGDFDRVLEMWNLSQDQDFKNAVGATGFEARRMNKAYMSDENHRHIGLRAARALRKSEDLLLPIGPFFDEWGSRLARHPDLSFEEVADVVRHLIDAWERLSPGNVGYARALAGVIESFPGGQNELSRYLPVKVERNLKAGLLHGLCSVPRHRFEEQWNGFALKFI